MAIFGGNPTVPTDEEKPKTDENGRVFEFVPKDIAQGTMDTVRGLQTGSIFAASEARANEALARGTQQMRSTLGAQGGPLLGQGAAVRAQQGLEQKALQTVGETQLGFSEQRAKGQETAVNLSIALEKLGEGAFNRQLKAVDLLIAEGGDANYKSAGEKLAALFPGMEFDFSRALQGEKSADFTAGMGMLANMLASGMMVDDAMLSAETQNLSESMGIPPDQLKNMYTEMQRQANPMLATMDALSFAAEQMGWDRDMLRQAQTQYMQDLTGMEVVEYAGKWTVVPFDGYTKVTSLANVQGGDMVTLTNNAKAADGTEIPAGKYYIVKKTETGDDSNAWTGDTTTTTTTVMTAVNADDPTRYYTLERTSSEAVSSTQKGWDEFFWPL